MSALLLGSWPLTAVRHAVQVDLFPQSIALLTRCVRHCKLPRKLIAIGVFQFADSVCIGRHCLMIRLQQLLPFRAGHSKLAGSRRQSFLYVVMRKTHLCPLAWGKSGCPAVFSTIFSAQTMQNGDPLKYSSISAWQREHFVIGIFHFSREVPGTPKLSSKNIVGLHPTPATDWRQGKSSVLLKKSGKKVKKIYFFSGRKPLRAKKPVSSFPATKSGLARIFWCNGIDV
jgi:hypothetical protein